MKRLQIVDQGLKAFKLMLFMIAAYYAYYVFTSISLF